MFVYNVTLTQQTKGFATTFDWPDNLTITDASAEGTAPFTYDAATETVSVDFE